MLPAYRMAYLPRMYRLPCNSPYTAMCSPPQVMIDENGDGRIEYNEFLSAAKSAMEDESLAVNRGSVAVREVLQKVSEYMRKNRVRGTGWISCQGWCSPSCCLCALCVPC